MFTTRRVGLRPRTMFPTLIRDFSIHSRPKVRSVRSKAATTESGEAASADTSGPIQSRSISSKRQVICRPTVLRHGSGALVWRCSIVVKVYDKPEETRERYSPGDFVTVEKSVGSGNPDLERACTSHVERKNGSLRQWCRRLTRLTYAFSKKKENLYAALALHFWFYNFARVHSSLRCTPAMEAGIANHIWSLRELMG